MAAGRTVDVRILALHVRCDACGESTRVPADCEMYAAWATTHLLPEILHAEVLIGGHLTRRPVRPNDRKPS